jgi:transketolase
MQDEAVEAERLCQSIHHGAPGAEAQRRWEAPFVAYNERFPELAREVDQMQRRELPAGWNRDLPSFPADPKGIAGRDASGEVLNVHAPEHSSVPRRLGGPRALELQAAIFTSASASTP